MIKVKRAYDVPSKQDGFRVLVDHIWPRGLKKEDAAIDRWLKAVAPIPQREVRLLQDPEAASVVVSGPGVSPPPLSQGRAEA